MLVSKACISSSVSFQVERLIDFFCSDSFNGKNDVCLLLDPLGTHQLTFRAKQMIAFEQGKFSCHG